MSYHWKSIIVTKSNVIHNIEIETPGVWREDAISQIKSLYDVKEIKTCIPISKSSLKDNNNDNNKSSYSNDMNLIIGFGVLFFLYLLRYIILFCILLIIIYFLYKFIQYIII